MVKTKGAMMSNYADKNVLNHDARLAYAAEFEHNGHTIKFVKGEQCEGSQRGDWYRHDRVEVNGKVLDGFIQVRRRKPSFPRIPTRIEASTCFGGGAVMGSDWEWLARQNGVDLAQAKTEKGRSSSVPKAR
jgi:hypothetical protein